MLFFAIAATSAGSYKEDQVFWADLPGAEHIANTTTFNSYAGYIQVDALTNKNLFYWFFEAETSPESAPIALWTNGGPGCSGFLGLLTEQGPIRPRSDGYLELNPFAWNKAANMLFIEAPAGVGFSYSDTLSDYTTGDNQTAVDNYKFIQGWLERFPQYRSNDFYITSESYGGHYMPTLAWEIVRRNLEGKDTPINFKGFAVGNAYTDAFTNNVAQYDKYWGNQIVSKLVYSPWTKKCTDPSIRLKYSEECNYYESQMDQQVGILNPYALDYPICSQMEQRRRIQHPGNFSQYDPCETDWTTKYLNRPEVKKAIHAKASITWASCSNTVKYSEVDVNAPMMPYYNKIIDSGADIKILVYSGDDDSVCATIGTQAWIYDLGYKVTSSWTQWFLNEQPAGAITRFEKNLSFVTVHDAGHEVPTYQPERALAMFKQYLSGDLFTSGASVEIIQ